MSNEGKSGKAVEWFLQLMEKNDGGVPAAKETDYACTWSTAGVIRAINRITGYQYTNPPLQKSVEWLLTDQNSDGGFGLGKGMDLSIEVTAEAIITLTSIYKENSDARVYQSIEKAVRWLTQNTESEGGWSFFPKGAHSTISTAKAIQALHIANEIIKDDDLVKHIKAKTQVAIKSLRKGEIRLNKKSMAWGLSNNSKAASPAGTVFAVLALNTIGKISQKEINRVMSYLENSRKSDGTWEATIERHKGYQFLRQATPYVVIMLVECKIDFTVTILDETILHVVKRISEGRIPIEAGSDIVTWPTRDYLLAFASILDLIKSSDIEQIMEVILASEQKAKVAKNELEKTTSQALRKVRNTILLLKITVALLSLILPILMIALMYYFRILSIELCVAILSVFFSAWGIFIALLINYGKEKT